MKEGQLSSPAVIEKARCSSLTNAGKPCSAYAVQGETRCAGHLGLGLAANPRDAQRQSAQAQRAKAENRREQAERAAMSTKQRLAMEAEARQDEIVAAYFDALKTGSPEDLRRAQAAEAIASRVFGRPLQVSREEASTELPASLQQLYDMTPEERRARLIELHRDNPAPSPSSSTGTPFVGANGNLIEP